NPDYAGTVTLTSSDTAATLPVPSTLTGGDMYITLRTLGNQTIRAVDAANPAIQGTSAQILVHNGTYGHLKVEAASCTWTGSISAWYYLVTAEDGLNNRMTDYFGMVRLSSTDPQAVLPADTGLSSPNWGVFHSALNTVGMQTITAVDLSGQLVSGTS